ncbi:hypothetical protein FRC03_008361 [Tulasnella sp. 419]|nr:hypothetical protein FRC03_008361 [Tulasnella sp. 419]
MPTATSSSINGLASRDVAPSGSHEPSPTQSSDLLVPELPTSKRRQTTVAPVGQNLTSANSSLNQENSTVEKLANWDDARVISSSDAGFHSAFSQGNTHTSAHSEGTVEGREESGSEVSQWRVQLSNYALEIFHALGNRIHAFGILAVKSQLTFAYFDRGRAIFSTFNLDKMFDELIKFIVGFSVLDAQGLGFNAHLQPPQGASCEYKDALSQNDLSGYTMTVRNKQITLKSLRDHRYELVSRGTMVYFGHIERVDDIVAIKLSWQPCNRTAEWGFIEHAKANGWTDDYLVKVHTCAKFEDLALSKGFRSHFLEKGIELNYEDREPRVLVSERLFNIGDLPSEALAHALWYIIRAIRHLDKAGIRHRDISDGNTGWNIREKDGEKRFVAFLYDFDLAKYIGCNQEQSSQGRTGTTPFMAIDLLRDPYCNHYLRFDFESTLWLGLYWCLQYSDNGKRIRDRNFIAEWSLGDFMEVAKEKDGYLIHPIDFRR